MANHASDRQRDEIRAFFTPRAPRWDTTFPHDGPAFATAVAELGLRQGDSVLDAGCGTGRALPPLREAVGPTGTVLAADLTPAMLDEVVRAGRHRYAGLLLTDVSRLPLRDGSLDAVFGGGLISHLPGPGAGLRELARVVRPGGVLALFHAVGRAALAARKGHALSVDDVRAEPNLRPLLASTGWRLTSYADEESRYLALAVRTG